MASDSRASSVVKSSASAETVASWTGSVTVMRGATFCLGAAGPAATARIGSGFGFGGARCTTDRGVALVDQRVDQHSVGVDVVLHRLVGPRCDRVDLDEPEALVERDERRIGPGRRLDAADAGDPGVVTRQTRLERDDLAQPAALTGGVACEEVAAQQFVLFGDGVLGGVRLTMSTPYTCSTASRVPMVSAKW